MITDFMSENEVSELLQKKRTALYNLRKKHGFPEPVLTHPARYSRQAVEKWINAGGVNRAV
ncbi:helix-turn-helix domain-containing protein [Salmonella enterica]|uniref:DNA-binding protein n=1 Tax=Salmonella enterica subsp. enterica serovar Weslaco TaxID=1243597 RepID=A0A5X3P3R7_SALET|nr:DNA-binding protein [Salmonella enterica]EBZ5929010.1 DNA-binding protein [Salmonella enterica subsp. enterica serovar Weslaco]ECC8718072.1 DNA-binding protein [Salmonella enterica subsp. houtenae]ECH8234478.1 DNA-binding protein [Salmonella enterica subsp. enterica]ECU9525894.1 DNA-binding protein [Salmonella enterica subsp. enterica serovar Sandiego]EDK5852711.1 DNA-binding protein [Salmonella enterica subsp. enterica serovar Newport]EDU6561880.1 helix-turn-helix domain-containing protei